MTCEIEFLENTSILIYARSKYNQVKEEIILGLMSKTIT